MSRPVRKMARGVHQAENGYGLGVEGAKSLVMG
jgi:hypothetical protein